MKRLLIISLLTLAGMYFGLCFYFSSRIIVPNKASVPDPKEFESRYGPVQLTSITTEDQVSLKGWYFKNPDNADCGIIMLHGRNASRYGMRHWMPFFWVKGCDILMYDHRAHGESSGDFGTFGVLESEDLVQVHDWLKKQANLTDQQIGWVGASWGASAALQTSDQDIDPMFILADSPFRDLDAAVMERAIRDYGNWVKVLVPTIYWLVEVRAGFNPYETSTMTAAKRISTPTLLIHSQTDNATSSDQSVSIAEAMNPEILTFHHTDWGSLHCKDVQDYPDRYAGLIEDFLKEHTLLQTSKLDEQLTVPN